VKCYAYKEDGTICGAQAVHFDQTREFYVCDQHAQTIANPKSKIENYPDSWPIVPSKLYEGRRQPDGHHCVTVRRQEHEPEPLRLLLSTSEYSWGVGGASEDRGKYDLALSLLSDAWPREKVLARKLYCDFKFQVVDIMPREGWLLSKEEIDLWSERPEIERWEWTYFREKWPGPKEAA
jgi:hypothetical protein